MKTDQTLKQRIKDQWTRPSIFLVASLTFYVVGMSLWLLLDPIKFDLWADVAEFCFTGYLICGFVVVLYFEPPKEK